MKISKEFEDKLLSVYTPDENERKLICEVSDQIIDLIDKYNLTDDQRIHLVSALYESMKDVYGIEEMKHIGEASE